MLGFGRKKRQKGLVVPQERDSPMVAYVKRVWPPEWQGVPLPEKLGRFSDICDLHEDLYSAVHRVAGGGDFWAKVHDQYDTKKYLGVDWFKLPGNPMIGGEEIEPAPPPEEELPEVTAFKERAARIRAETEAEALRSELRELKQVKTQARQQRAVPPPRRAEAFKVTDARITIDPPPQPQPATPSPVKRPRSPLRHTQWRQDHTCPSIYCLCAGVQEMAW